VTACYTNFTKMILIHIHFLILKNKNVIIRFIHKIMNCVKCFLRIRVQKLENHIKDCSAQI
jgi:hypothetical protein